MMSVRMTSGSRLGAITRSCERPLPSALNSHCVLQEAWGNTLLRKCLITPSIALSQRLDMSFLPASKACLQMRHYLQAL